MPTTAAVLSTYWGSYQDPNTLEFVVFPIQQIKDGIWYTFGYHFKPSTTQILTYLNGNLVETVGSADGVPSFTKINEIGFYGDRVPQGATDNLEYHKYLDNVTVGTSGFGSSDVFSCNFESYALGEEWHHLTSHPPWTTVQSDSGVGELTDGLTIAAAPYGRSGQVMNFKSHNETVFGNLNGLSGGSIFFDWAGTPGDVYIQFDYAFDTELISLASIGDSFATDVWFFSVSSDTTSLMTRLALSNATSPQTPIALNLKAKFRTA